MDNETDAASEEELTIDDVEFPEKTCRKKRKISIPSDVEENEDLEHNLEASAQKFNLSRTQVRSFLRKVVGFPQLYQMSLEKAKGKEFSKSLFEPRITRTVAKSMIEVGGKLDWILETLNASKQPLHNDTLAFVNGELKEDDDDPEYDPSFEDEEEFDDEETSTSTNTTSKQKESLVKSPETPRALETLEENKDFDIRLTRSKTNLTDVPIQELEKKLFPPDITSDMYSWETDEYSLFLQETFGYHEESQSSNREEDPDFVYQENPDDTSDLPYEFQYDRSTKIPQKEVDDLIFELITEYEERDVDKGENYCSQSHFSETELKSPKNSEQRITEQKEEKEEEQQRTLESLLIGEKDDVENDNEKEEEGKNAEEKDKQTQNETMKESLIQISREEKALLSQQLRQHIQLLTQSRLLTSYDPELNPLNKQCKNMMSELVMESLKKAYSIFAQDNLFSSLSFVDDWEQRGESPIDVNSTRKFGRNKTEHILSPRLMTLMGNSRVFIYSSLLPAVSHHLYSLEKVYFSEAEDQLIIYGILKFSDGLPKKKGKSTLVKLIAQHLMPPKKPIQIRSRIKNQLRTTKANIIKTFIETSEIDPSIFHDPIIPYSYHTCPLLKDSNDLPQDWVTFFKNNHLYVPSIISSSVLLRPSNHSLTTARDRILKKYKKSSNVVRKIVPKPEEILTSKSALNNIKISYEPETLEERKKRQENEAGEIFLCITECLPANKVEEFCRLLSSHSSKNKVSDLFIKLNDLCHGITYLQDGLLDILNPEDAIELGESVYQSYTLRNNIKEFFRKLSFTYKEPILSKVYKELNVFLSSPPESLPPSPSILFKNMAFKLFKNNRVLIEEFLSILPNELLISETIGEEADLNEDFKTSEKASLSSSNVLGSEICPCSCHFSSKDIPKKNHCLHCSLKFLNGRVYMKEGKVMRPVRIQYPESNGIKN